jgi:hypothetical protein
VVYTDDIGEDDGDVQKNAGRKAARCVFRLGKLGRKREKWADEPVTMASLSERLIN